MILQTLKDGWMVPLGDQKVSWIESKKRAHEFENFEFSFKLNSEAIFKLIFNIYSWWIFYLLKVISEAHVENEWMSSVCNISFELKYLQFVILRFIPIGLFYVKLTRPLHGYTKGWHMLKNCYNIFSIFSKL